jgi:CubicO group peptidase (beta-lactamase class C family)
VLLIRADLAAAQRRAAQLNTVVSGLEVKGVEQRDLSAREPAELTGAMLTRIERYVRKQLDRFKIPGAAVAIVQDGEIVYSGGFGVRRKGGSEPITADTHMMIGSTGKSMTTAMMASQVGEGLYGWDTPVVELLPRFRFANPELTEEVSVENLVCACSGVPRRDLELFFEGENLSAEGVVESLAEFELFTDFGETFQYSNQMVASAGYVAAAADGAQFGALQEGYAESLEARILDPLGMPRTTLSFEAVRERGEYARPHALEFGFDYAEVPLSQERFVEPVAPAGGHWSTADEMARYMVMQLRGGIGPEGTRIVSEDALLHTRKSQVGVSAETDYGLGWFVDEWEGVRLIHHGGNSVGFTSSFGFLPNKGLGVLVLMNAQAANSVGSQIRDFVFDLAFDNYDEAEDEEELRFALKQLTRSVERPEGLQERADPARVQGFTGSYHSDALGRVDLRLEESRLLLDAGPFKSELLPVVAEGGADGEGPGTEGPSEEVDRYVFAEPPLRGFPAELKREDGAASLVVGKGAQEYRFRRVSQ